MVNNDPAEPSRVGKNRYPAKVPRDRHPDGLPKRDFELRLYRGLMPILLIHFGGELVDGKKVLSNI